MICKRDDGVRNFRMSSPLFSCMENYKKHALRKSKTVHENAWTHFCVYTEKREGL